MKRVCTLALTASTMAIAKNTRFDPTADNDLNIPTNKMDAPEQIGSVPSFGKDAPMGSQEAAFNEVKEIVYYIQQTWAGAHQGFYGISMNKKKLEPECFGGWIAEDLEFIYNYFETLSKKGLWEVTYEDTTQLAYDVVDLIFLQDQYCHFRTTITDIIHYCEEEDKPCAGTKILSNLQVNAFSMITQISQVVSSFTSQKWSDMDIESRGYTLHQVGQATTSLVAGILGFHPE